MRKIMAMLVALVMSLGLMAGMASPASATGATNWKTVCENRTYYHALGNGFTATFCIEIGYRKQDDGTGWRVEDLWVDINNGCGDLEGSSKLKDPTASVGDPYNVNLTKTASVSWPYFGTCHAYRDVELKGPETGPMNFYFDAEVDINNGTNKNYSQVFFIG